MKVFAILMTLMVASTTALPIVISPNDIAVRSPGADEIVQRAPGNGHNTGGGTQFRRDAEPGNGHNTGGGTQFRRDAQPGNGHNTGGGTQFKREADLGMVAMMEAAPIKRSAGPGNGHNTGGGTQF